MAAVACNWQGLDQDPDDSSLKHAHGFTNEPCLFLKAVENSTRAGAETSKLQAMLYALSVVG